MNGLTQTDRPAAGFIYSGVSYQFTFKERQENVNRLQTLNVWELDRHNLHDFDVLIVPRGSDQEALYAHRKTIARYLEMDGIVASFGEITTDWLPGVRWDGVLPSDDGPLSFASTHPFLAGLQPVDLHWHKGFTGWCSHGHFKEPPDAEVLVRTEVGDPVMYLQRPSTGGVIIAASEVDVVCHAAHGVEGAQKMFENILRWVSEVKR